MGEVVLFMIEGRGGSRLQLWGSVGRGDVISYRVVRGGGVRVRDRDGRGLLSSW